MKLIVSKKMMMVFQKMIKFVLKTKNRIVRKIQIYESPQAVTRLTVHRLLQLSDTEAFSKKVHLFTKNERTSYGILPLIKSIDTLATICDTKIEV